MWREELKKKIEELAQEGEKKRYELYNLLDDIIDYVEELAKKVEGRQEEYYLPWGYKLVKYHSSGGNFLYLVDPNERLVNGGIDGGYYLAGDFSCWIEGTDLETLLDFANDIEDGWLDEVLKYYEEKIEEEKKAIEVVKEKARNLEK